MPGPWRPWASGILCLADRPQYQSCLPGFLQHFWFVPMIPCVIMRYLGPSAIISCGVSGADYVQPCEKSHPPPGTGVPLMWGTNTHTELLVLGLMSIHPSWSSDSSLQAMMVPTVAREAGVCMHPSLTGHTLGSWFVPAKSHASMLSSTPARWSLSKLTVLTLA